MKNSKLNVGGRVKYTNAKGPHAMSHGTVKKVEPSKLNPREKLVTVRFSSGLSRGMTDVVGSKDLKPLPYTPKVINKSVDAKGRVQRKYEWAKKNINPNEPWANREKGVLEINGVKRNYQTGPRGGRYYITDGGTKVYV